jgi:hypothetical protein
LLPSIYSRSFVTRFWPLRHLFLKFKSYNLFQLMASRKTKKLAYTDLPLSNELIDIAKDSQ